MRVETVDSIRRLEELRPAWDALVSDVADDSPFLGIDWFLCCFEAYGAGKRCQVLVISDGDRVTGIVPLWLRRVGQIFPIDVLSFVRGPETLWVDFLVAEDDREVTLRTLIRHLFGEGRQGWTILDLEEWSGNSPNFGLFQELLCEDSRHILVDTASESPRVAHDGSWEEYLQHRSKKYRKTSRNIFNRMGRLEDVEVELHCADLDGSLVDTMIAVSGRSWKEAEGISLGRSPNTERFFRRWTSIAGRRQWLQMWLLRVKGEPVAMEYAVQCGDGAIHALRASYDQRFSKYSPGAYLQQRILQHLFDSGGGFYNMGPGLSPYKLQAADQIIQNRRVRVFNTNLGGRVSWAMASAVVPLAHKVLRSFRNSVASRPPDHAI